MKRVLIVLFLVFMFVPSAYGQTFVESQHLVDSGKYSPKLAGQMVQPAGKTSIVAWFAMSQTWGEGLFGISKSVAPWMSVGVVAGFETHPHPLRVQPSVWLGTKQASAFTCLEFGGSGWWYKSMGGVKVTEKVEIGYHAQRGYGVGPLVRVKLPGKITAWTSVVQGPKAMVGIRKTF